MIKFKSLDELLKIDETHLAFAQITGKTPDLKFRHEYLQTLNLHVGVPEEIRSQFNLVKNMTLYQYFLYALASDIQFKTYTIIEYALKLKDAPVPEIGLKALVKKAVKMGWIEDSGFRHIEHPNIKNSYCNSLVEILPSLRNEAAHGSNILNFQSNMHLEICCDFVNQLFDMNPAR